MPVLCCLVSVTDSDGVRRSRRTRFYEWKSSHHESFTMSR